MQETDRLKASRNAAFSGIPGKRRDRRADQTKAVGVSDCAGKIIHHLQGADMQHHDCQCFM